MLLQLFFIENSCSQVNIVPNPSFEFFTTCPTGSSQISYAYPWFMPSTGTSDYFNSCNTGSVGVPTNALGYQNARTGVAYAGGLMTTGFREYISSPLTSILIKDKDYCIEFYINLANTSFPMPSDTVIVGMYISTDSIYSSTFDPLLYSPQIFNPTSQNINDTVNWIRISGIYKALGGEQFITIGNFYSDEFFFGGNYYYVDDVSIVECDTQIFSIPNFFTPNNDGINDIFEIKDLPENTLTQIYNRWGIKVFDTNKSNIFWDGRTTSGNESVDGTYFYVITTVEEIYKGHLQLIR